MFFHIRRSLSRGLRGRGADNCGFQISNRFCLANFLSQFSSKNMHFLSVSNRKTQLHKSPGDLSIVASYEHEQKGTVSSDISLFSSEAVANSFCQIYKTNIVEVFRVKKKSTNDAGELRSF
jgi:hypothetical protein